MLETIELKQRPELKKIVTAAFPNYKKHKAFLSQFSELNINSYWDGGSKSEYVCVHVPTLTRRPLPSSSHPYFDIHARGIQGENAFVKVDHVGNVYVKQLPADCVIVEAGYFCGKPSTAHIHMPTPAALPAANEPKQIEDVIECEAI